MRGLAVMRMPEAPVDKNYLSARTEHQIGLSRKVFPMQPEPVAQLMHDTSHPQLGLHVFAADRPHIGTAVHQRRPSGARMPLSATGQKPFELQ
jgi:hypothetical protein